MRDVVKMIAACAGLTLAGFGTASAEWRAQVTPYVWAPGIDATVRPLAIAPAVDIHRSIGDVIGDLDAAFFITGSARRERLVLLGDFSWSALSQSASMTLPGFGPVNVVNARERVGMATVAAGYTVFEGEGIALDLFAGARAWFAKVSIDLPPVSASFSDSFSWSEPLVGGRVRFPVGERWSVIGQGDVGGLGLSAVSSWQALGALNFEATPHLYLSAGYRHLSLSHEKNGRLLDSGLGGPLLGVTWRF